jgi:hypothetical protein
MKATAVRATTLSPFHYGHLAVQGGTATISEFIGDRAVVFGLCSAFGLMSSSLILPEKPNYRRHLGAMPWRTSMFHTHNPRLLPPLARRSDLGAEGGYPDRVRRAANTGNFKEFFTIQEVPPDQVFHGAIFGEDPFERIGSDKIVTRIGSNRTGLLLLERGDANEPIRLNAATAALFDRSVRSERYILHDMQVSASMSLDGAVLEVAQWTL